MNKSIHSWRRTTHELGVTYSWWYDTVAILDEYDDYEIGRLPSGELIQEFERINDGEKVVCNLKERKRLERSQLPKGRIMRFFPFSFATPLQVIISRQDFENHTEEIH